jgi:hypothetical protein
MNRARVLAVAGMVVAGGAAMTHAGPPGVTRADLLRHDLSVAGREVVQTRVGIAPGVTAARQAAGRPGAIGPRCGRLDGYAVSPFPVQHRGGGR